MIQEAWVPHEDAVYDRVGNIMLTRIMGAESQLVDEGFDIGIRDSWKQAIEDVKAKGGKPYAIPAGASVHKFGGLGYVGFAEEVRKQEAEMGIRFDYIIVCTVTGSTHAGMVVGFKPDGRADKVIGIDASCTPAQTRAQVLEIARNTSALVGAGEITEDDVVIKEDYAYPVYGVPSKETVEAIRLAARLEAMITDPVYEGKSMQGMIDLVQKGFFPKGSKVLYAHLGGAPALNGTATRSVTAEAGGACSADRSSLHRPRICDPPSHPGAATAEPGSRTAVAAEECGPLSALSSSN